MIIFGIASSAYLVALLIIHLLAPRLEPAQNLDGSPPGPVTLGSLLGFGFVGFILGTFAGWCVGLITKQSGQTLLRDMIAGAVVGVVVGIVIGNILSKMRRAEAVS
jgi:uncharacterized membrane protein YeaQ/YmgE (transglycosylase-associated protein family)